MLWGFFLSISTKQQSSGETAIDEQNINIINLAIENGVEYRSWQKAREKSSAWELLMCISSRVGGQEGMAWCW